MARPKVIFFDVNETLLDLAPLKQSVGEVLGGRADLAPVWFTTMLQYSLVTTVADRYHNFDEIGVACLQMVANNQGIALDEAAAKEALSPIRRLSAHDDVLPGLQRLRQQGFTLVALTNSATALLADQMHNSGLQMWLDRLLSIEAIGLYKPHTHVYRWAARQLETEISECMMVAAHGWDVAGAVWAGMPAAFITRPGQQRFPLGPPIDTIVPTLTALADKLETMV